MGLIDDLRKQRGQQKDQQKATRGGGQTPKAPVFKLASPGYYGIYVCPPNAATHPWPFLLTLMHSNVGPEEKFHPCLGRDNTVIWSASVQEAIARRNERMVSSGHPDWVLELDIEEGCPTCDEIANPSGAYTDEQIKSMRAKEDYFGMVVPFYYQGLNPNDAVKYYPKSQWVLHSHYAKPVHAEKIHDWMVANGIDCTDPSAVVLMRLRREGMGKYDTRYSLEPDTKTLRDPKPLPKPVLAQLKTLEVGGENDPILQLVERRLRSHAQVLSMLGGAPVQTAAEGEEGPPPCFEDPQYHDPNDSYCQECSFFDPCAAAVAEKTAARPTRPAPTPAGKPPVSAAKPVPAGKAPAPHPASGKPGNGQQRPPVATSQQGQGDIPGAEEAAAFMQAVADEPDDNGYAEEPDNSDPFGAEFEAAVEEARKGN